MDKSTTHIESIILFFLPIYCCTSLERVAFSWIMEIAITRTQNRTAFACPSPFHWAPALA